MTTMNNKTDFFEIDRFCYQIMITGPITFTGYINEFKDSNSKAQMDEIVNSIIDVGEDGVVEIQIITPEQNTYSIGFNRNLLIDSHIVIVRGGFRIYDNVFYPLRSDISVKRCNLIRTIQLFQNRKVYRYTTSISDHIETNKLKESEGSL